ncbi:MAG: hypothetical protein DRJ56_04230 [Thermoprotei archaeon]|nr:MAG: hypothetical protein DRJ56_04230 [Thermoprotei archaeon]
MASEPALALEEAVRLHGHRGPWLVMGYRAGARACEVLDPTDEFSLYCVVKTPLRTPYTCAVDGIQASTRCTLGKLLISVEEASADEIAYIFIDRRSGRRLELRLRPGVAEWVSRLCELGMEVAAREVERAPLWRLFEERLCD